uniref:Reverse transcriptase zinc-binding domain-containing protein n=1 Tax=Lactuca sativa TaxID=4236 RepID=A0A9R1UCL5_LACSA|nr:hypothetical protein LSAT_V11C900459440 [Lactuca sativa]
MGGIGIGCLDSANFTLLAKWWWRLENEYESFWFSCIQAIHNIKLIDGKAIAKKSIKGVWSTISQIVPEFEQRCVLLASLFNNVVGKGDKTFFWKDCWLGDMALKEIIANLYAIDKTKDCLVRERLLRMEKSLFIVGIGRDILEGGVSSDNFMIWLTCWMIFNFMMGMTSGCGGAMEEMVFLLNISLILCLKTLVKMCCSPKTNSMTMLPSDIPSFGDEGREMRWGKEKDFGDRDFLSFSSKTKKDKEGLQCILSEGNTLFRPRGGMIVGPSSRWPIRITASELCLPFLIKNSDSTRGKRCEYV